MEDFQNIATKGVSKLEKEGKISEMQSKLLFSLIKQENISETIVKGHSEEEILLEIMKILEGVSFNLSIPQRGIYDDVSSPLDTLLQSKKRQTCSTSFSLVNTKILKKMSSDLSPEINFN